MSIATTKAVLPFCSTTAIDWDRVTSVLTDPQREVLPGRSAHEVFGEDWPEVVRVITDATVDQQVPLAAALQASMFCRRWWGMPGYESQVDELVASEVVRSWTGNASELTNALLHHPLVVPLEVWEEIALGKGSGWNDR